MLFGIIKKMITFQQKKKNQEMGILSVLGHAVSLVTLDPERGSLCNNILFFS